MRRLIFAGLAFGALAGCGGGNAEFGGDGSGADTTSLGLEYEVLADGGSLYLFWNDVEDALGYYIYADGELLDSTLSTSYVLTEENACAKAWVEALLPGGSVAETLDIAGQVVKSSVYDWGELNSPYNSALGFVDGEAVTYSTLDQDNYSNFEIILDDGYSGVDPTEIDLCSPDVYDPPYNGHANGFASWTGGVVAPAPGNYWLIYPYTGGVQVGASYAAWLDPAGDGWDVNDHFVRIDINSVGSDGQVQATFYYQAIGGLRWVPVE